MKTNLIIPAIASVLTLTAMADVPHMIHHQGILQDNEGVPVNGPAEFKFAFVNQAGDESFWSNDGTSVAGAEPTNFVALPVSDGLFNVQLGDTGIGMLELPPSVFASNEVFLRIWVNGEQLAPDRQVTSVGFAMQAATVAAGAINPGSIPDNTIQSNHIVDHSITSADLAPALTINSLNLEQAGKLRTELSSSAGGRLRLWDGLDTMTAYLGTTVGGGDLNLFQMNGKPGIMLNGDAATYSNGASAGGELTVHDSAGNVGVLLDGQNNGGARISVNKPGGFQPFVDIFGNGSNDGAEVRVLGNKGVKGVEIFGQGSPGGLGNADPNNPDGRNVDGAGQINLYQSGGLGAVIYGSAVGGGGAISLRNQATDTKFILSGGPYSASMKMAQNSGVVSIEADAAHGTFGGSRFVMRQDVTNKGAVNTIQLDGGTNDLGDGGGRVRLRNESGQVTVELDAADGDGNGLVRTQVLEITGGSDLSEQFNINGNDLKPEPGMLVSIDPVNAGELVLSTTAYDRTAAGVISGAGGVNPGMMMGQDGSIADGDHPVALTGRVYCYVDASFGAIEPGDLITTSSTPGHGMKVGDHDQAQGAIVGKAMTSLKDGRGLVLVLVSLQ
ncbi:hypothetical protein [Luteolibacter marinus]|uniref:hypothetical protein n=1 Tax=Luteolibacter marinus TaxID=2776705 RepID=UPI001869557C|nr:hypothetical protein [Luteolibacter marinus]